MEKTIQKIDVLFRVVPFMSVARRLLMNTIIALQVKYRMVQVNNYRIVKNKINPLQENFLRITYSGIGSAFEKEYFGEWT